MSKIKKQLASVLTVLTLVGNLNVLASEPNFKLPAELSKGSQSDGSVEESRNTISEQKPIRFSTKFITDNVGNKALIVTDNSTKVAVEFRKVTTTAKILEQNYSFLKLVLLLKKYEAELEKKSHNFLNFIYLQTAKIIRESTDVFSPRSLELIIPPISSEMQKMFHEEYKKHMDDETQKVPESFENPIEDFFEIYEECRKLLEAFRETFSKINVKQINEMPDLDLVNIVYDILERPDFAIFREKFLLKDGAIDDSEIINSCKRQYNIDLSFSLSKIKEVSSNKNLN